MFISDQYEFPCSEAFIKAFYEWSRTQQHGTKRLLLWINRYPTRFIET